MTEEAARILAAVRGALEAVEAVGKALRPVTSVDPLRGAMAFGWDGAEIISNARTAQGHALALQKHLARFGHLFEARCNGR